ncbi:MAG: glycosyltransferase [Patescibacteria group bacterium]|nr:glycosyltransferase [Patescibacteria group bacterium]
MRFLYISTGRNFPPDKHLVDGLRENAHEVLELIENGHGFGRYVRFARCFPQATRAADAVIVGYGLPLLVPIARCLTQRTVIFNAIASQYEANVISRGDRGLFAVCKWMLIDFFSFHAALFVLLESEAQVAYVASRFFVPKKKLVVARMGVDESVFFRDGQIKKRKAFTVLFRGRFLPESGILTVIAAAKRLENTGIRFLIIGHGFLYREVNALVDKLAPTNIEFVEKTLPEWELREAMLSCHISLGQLADHPRLARTLPAKLYESLALGLPYLTGRSAAVFELLTEDTTCFVVQPGDATALADKIRSLEREPKHLREVGEAGYRLFTERLVARRLAADFVATCFG